MTSSEKITKAKLQLILTQPFFATLSLRMQYVDDPSIDTACTNGSSVRYNPHYIDCLTIDEVKGLLAHEIMHVALLHHTRREDRQPSLWNVAADYAINPLLITAGFALPDGHLIDEKFSNMSAEEIYQLLPPKPPNEGAGGGTGDVEDAESAKMNEEEAEVKQALVQAVLIAQRQGNLPEHLKRLVNEIIQPRISWQEQLARFLVEIAKNDYTWCKPSSRYLHTGLYMPSLESQEIGKLILLIDTSGSVDDILLNQFSAEVQQIAVYINTKLVIIYIDTEVQSVQEIEPQDDFKLKPAGGGGTDFRPGFSYIDEHNLNPKAVIYLTDGECLSFPQEPDYAVLWAQFGHFPFIPPFGEVITVR